MTAIYESGELNLQSASTRAVMNTYSNEETLVFGGPGGTEYNGVEVTIKTWLDQASPLPPPDDLESTWYPAKVDATKTYRVILEEVV